MPLYHAPLVRDADGNYLVNIIPRTGTLASLQALAGGNGEISSATDTKALLQHNAVGGQAKTFYPTPPDLRIAEVPGVIGYITDGLHQYTIGGAEFATLQEALDYFKQCVIHPNAIISIKCVNELTAAVVIADAYLPQVELRPVTDPISILGTIASQSGTAGAYSVVLNVDGGTAGVIAANNWVQVISTADVIGSLNGLHKCTAVTSTTATISVLNKTAPPANGTTYNANVYYTAIGDLTLTRCVLGKIDGLVLGHDGLGSTWDYVTVLRPAGVSTGFVSGINTWVFTGCDLKVGGIDGTILSFIASRVDLSGGILNCQKIDLAGGAVVDNAAQLNAVGYDVTSVAAVYCETGGSINAAGGATIIATGPASSVVASAVGGGSQILCAGGLTISGVTTPATTPKLNTIGNDGSFVSDGGNYSNTYTDVTASRALNTTYTNSNTRSIMVMASARCVVTVAAGSATIQGKSDTSATPTTIASPLVGLQAGLLNEDNTFMVTFVVAAGLKYRVDSAVANGTATLGTWWELVL